MSCGPGRPAGPTFDSREGTPGHAKALASAIYDWCALWPLDKRNSQAKPMTSGSSANRTCAWRNRPDAPVISGSDCISASSCTVFYDSFVTDGPSQAVGEARDLDLPVKLGSSLFA